MYLISAHTISDGEQQLIGAGQSHNVVIHLQLSQLAHVCMSAHHTASAGSEFISTESAAVNKG